ncbi:hypothetical protein K227x_17220 [Rubripirellula lacrimiformis]|uniref:Uncharacterized protein n=1 Tax=Rubripirellula lacrimiformis TaxID=1930273 RepID=A0A517N894_9BACT|nr:hypothetical protein [Rubripirellula lacrimiformis]QDT03340.1 hypothetical protein K227x_17220 [Rubripirellula lacrimiformis]
MHAQSESSVARESTRISAFGLVAVHAVALLVLYFVPVFICPTVVDHYSRVGVPETSLFLRAHLISDYFAAYTPFWMAAAAVYLFVLYRRSRAGSRWLPAVSNLVILSIAFFGMVYTAWMIHPMTSSVGGVPVAVDASETTPPELAIARIGE